MYEFHLISPSSFCRTVINIYLYIYQQNYYVYLEIDQLLLLNVNFGNGRWKQISAENLGGNKTPTDCSNVWNHPFISISCCVHSEDIPPKTYLLTSLQQLVYCLAQTWQRLTFDMRLMSSKSCRIGQQQICTVQFFAWYSDTVDERNPAPAGMKSKKTCK